MKIYAWYAGTTGLALKRRTEMVMSPPCPSREEDIANVLEQWAEQVRLLSGFGTAHILPATYKITALSQIMKNKKERFEEFEDQARDLHPNNEEQQFEIIYNKVLEFATRRRLEANQARMKGDLMDCNGVGAEYGQYQEAYQDQYAYEGYEINEAHYGGGVCPYAQDQYQQHQT
jgi:hypothetical protein